MKGAAIAMLALLLSIQIAHGISVELSAPDKIMQGEHVSASIRITAHEKFSGEMFLNYVNLEHTANKAAISNSSFKGSGPYTYEISGIGIKGISPGEYKIYAEIRDLNGFTIGANAFSGEVESAAPKILSRSPSGIIASDTVSLQVTTDKDSVCRLDTSDRIYSNMSTRFQVTGEKSHRHVVSGLAQKEHLFYVRCSDINGYEMAESAVIRFVVDHPPYAEIRLSQKSPLKAGVIEVTLLPSEDLVEEPRLEYSFDTSPGTRRVISLTRDGSLWKGHMIITESDDNKVGTFYFTGKNKYGTQGNVIVSGKTFIVDTTKPPAPAKLEAIAQKDGKIQINWYYDGEEVDHFRIYRSTSPGVSYLDLYRETSNITRYTDVSTEDRVTYYYRVAAVDLAGNIGPFSDEAYATSRDESKAATEAEKQDEAPRVLPPNLVIFVNDEIKRADSMMIDCDEIIISLEDNENKELVSELGLIDEVRDAKKSLEAIKERLSKLKENYMEESQLNNELEKARLDMARISQRTPKDIRLVDKASLTQIASNEEIRIAANRLFMNSGFDDIDKEMYIRHNEEIQRNIEVSLRAYVAEIELMDSSKKDKTLIIKSIRHKGAETLEDVLLFEIIPREIAENVRDINFFRRSYEAVDDNIAKFGFARLDFSGSSIKYSVDRKVHTDDIERASSVVLIGPMQIEKGIETVTGFAVGSVFGREFGIGRRELIFIGFGIALIAVLTGYQVFISKRSFGKGALGGIKSKGSRVKEKLNPNNYDHLGFEKREKTETDVLEELIDWSKGYIEIEEMNRARMIYPQIELIYKRLPKEEKVKVIKKCLELQSMLKRVK